MGNEDLILEKLNSLINTSERLQQFEDTQKRMHIDLYGDPTTNRPGRLEELGEQLEKCNSSISTLDNTINEKLIPTIGKALTHIASISLWQEGIQGTWKKVFRTVVVFVAPFLTGLFVIGKAFGDVINDFVSWLKN